MHVFATLRSLRCLPALMKTWFCSPDVVNNKHAFLQAVCKILDKDQHSDVFSAFYTDISKSFDSFSLPHVIASLGVSAIASLGAACSNFSMISPPTGSKLCELTMSALGQRTKLVVFKRVSPRTTPVLSFY